MKALFLVADGVEDSEFFYPYYRMKEEGIDVVVAGPKKEEIAGKHGYTFNVEKAFGDISIPDYDLLVLPGGKAPESVRLDEKAVLLTKEMVDSGKLVAAICHGAQTLISANVLKGKKATCWPGIRDDLKAAGALYEDSEVVVDGNLVTSRCPDDLPAFCREIFKRLVATKA